MADGWTIAQIISEFRDLTGRKSTSQISDANILVRVNLYYQNQFQFDLKFRAPALEVWYTFNTVDGTGSQTLTADEVRVGSPVYVDDEPATFWIDEERFYSEYPHDYDTEDKPSDILLFGRTLILRPIPDAVYEVRLRKSDRPDAWALGNTVTPPPLGPVLAYGAAIMFLGAKGESDIAQEHIPLFNHFLGTMQSYCIKQISKRPRGGRF